MYVHLLKGKSLQEVRQRETLISWPGLIHSKVTKKIGEKETQDPEAKTGLKKGKGNRGVRG